MSGKIIEMVLFVTKGYGQECLSYARQHNLRITVLSLDSEVSRRIVQQGAKFTIDTVPTLVVTILHAQSSSGYPPNTPIVQLFTGPEKIIAFFNAVMAPVRPQEYKPQALSSPPKEQREPPKEESSDEEEVLKKPSRKKEKPPKNPKHKESAKHKEPVIKHKEPVKKKKPKRKVRFEEDEEIEWEAIELPEERGYPKRPAVKGFETGENAVRKSGVVGIEAIAKQMQREATSRTIGGLEL